MKSRAFARVMALQCIRRGESIYLTDPKSELYEDLSSYCRECGYTVKQLNLIQLEHSDAWDCLGEIDDGSLIDRKQEQSNGSAQGEDMVLSQMKREMTFLHISAKSRQRDSGN